MISWIVGCRHCWSRSFWIERCIVYLARMTRSVLVFDARSPRNQFTRATHGFITRDDQSPEEIRFSGIRDITQNQFAGLQTDQQRLNIIFESGLSVRADVAFVSAEIHQVSDLHRQLGCHLRADGRTFVKPTDETLTQGVYAVGDCVLMRHQIVHSAAGGATVEFKVNASFGVV